MVMVLVHAHIWHIVAMLLSLQDAQTDKQTTTTTSARCITTTMTNRVRAVGEHKQNDADCSWVERVVG